VKSKRWALMSSAKSNAKNCGSCIMNLDAGRETSKKLLALTVARAVAATPASQIARSNATPRRITGGKARRPDNCDEGVAATSRRTAPLGRPPN